MDREQDKKQYQFQQILPILFAVTNKIQTNCDKLFAPITTRQFMAIITICHIDTEKCTFQRLANQMGTTKQNMAQLVLGLQKRKIVTVEENPADKRSKLIKLTEKGWEVAEQAIVTANEIIDQMKQAFTGEELKELYRLLGKLYSYDQVKARPLHGKE